LAVFSPVALTPDVKAKVAELGGNVRYLIAGDFEHHIFLSEWAKEYPEAKLIGPEGLPEKRAGMNDEKIGKEEFAYVFTPTNKSASGISEEFAHDFEVEYVDAHPNKEIVLLYKPDKVLIEADLMFNLPATEQYSKVPDSQKTGNGLANRFFNSLNNTEGDAKGHKRLQWYLFSNGNKNRQGYNESAKKINGWDFTTLIPCHGETIVGNAKEVFQKVFEWHIQGHK
jgi:glyoxylase-like metal-dependent hydrolase (beta-lactamase superfamily II)